MGTRGARLKYFYTLVIFRIRLPASHSKYRNLEKVSTWAMDNRLKRHLGTYLCRCF